MKTKIFVKISVLLVFTVLAFVSSQALASSRSVKKYSVAKVVSSAGMEYQLMYSAPDSSSTPQHFLSVIVNAGAVSIRAHPGNDLNGWGTSWYPQPFFPDANLQGAKVAKPTVGKKGITVTVTGTVSSGMKKNVGSFRVVLVFTYDSSAKRISGTGTCTISLSKSPSALNLSDPNLGDLNLCKIATNYLHDVPLLGGGTGDTGDMSEVNVVGDSFPYVWDLIANPSFFPQDITDTLSVNVAGQYNNVDAAAQGYAPIAAAHKPGVNIIYVSKKPGVPMIFGAIYDTNEETEFWPDNVGITPLILKTSPVKKYAFDITFQSTALVNIVASADSNGSISPNGPVDVNIGDSQTFIIAANPNYQIKDVLVDGSSVGAVTSYTFTDVTSDHTISASFIEKIADLQWETISLPDTNVTGFVSLNDTIFCLSNWSRIWKSGDMGNSWIPISVQGLSPQPSYFTNLDANDGNLYVTARGGLLVSNDMGESFSYPFQWWWDTTTDVDFHNGYGWMTISSWGSLSGVLKKNPESALWQHVYWDSCDWVVADPLDPNNVAYTSGATHGAVRTLDGGNTWLDCQYEVQFATTIDNNSVAFGDGFFTKDYGETWQDAGFKSHDWILSYVKDPNSGFIFAGGLSYTDPSSKDFPILYVGLPGKWNLCTMPENSASGITSLVISDRELFMFLNNGTMYRADIPNISP